MKFSLFLVALFCFALAINAEFKHKKSKKWLNHSKKYNLAFKNDQTEANAFEEFLKVDKIIQEHNSKNDVSYTLGHNEYSHLGSDFFKNLKGSREVIDLKYEKRGFKYKQYRDMNGFVFNYYEDTPGYMPPASIDWVANGWNTTVRNQRPCGNCYAFVATASVEFGLWKKNNIAVTLSPQELTDCSQSFHNDGCNSGSVQFALEYIQTRGINLESNYNYTSGSNNGYSELCRLPTGQSGININVVKGFVAVDPGNDLALIEVLNKYGAVGVSIATRSPRGNYDSFDNYKSGLFSDCTSTLDHGVLLVGYGIYDASNTQNPNLFGKKYWRIKNSWGPTWGNGGYMDISRETLNTCGISSQAVVPTFY